MDKTHEPFVNLVLSCSTKYKRSDVIRFVDGEQDDKVLAACFEQWSYGNTGAIAEILDSANPKVRVVVKKPSGTEYETIDNPNFDQKANPKAKLAV